MAFGIDDAVGAVSSLAATIINKVFPDPQDAAKAKALLEAADAQAAIQQTASQLQAIVAEAQSTDKWTSRARPSFLYVCYCMILTSIPMGVLYAFDANHAQKIAAGLQAWLAAIPDPVWQLFTVGYLGYTGGRSWEKIKGASR
ncbi:MAG TPA: 3TM-type holin [Stellaceae bacterium]|nr:3TM-type holin [Stellaceae bacterium]